MMRNPYSSCPDSAFWRRAVAAPAMHDVDPVITVPFKIQRTDKIATAGSCFAQHISRTLMAEGFEYLVTESTPQSPWAVDEGMGVFPARFGNIYSVRQLLQLFQRAYGLYRPLEATWQRPDGKFVDPFRPRVQECGYPSPEAVEADRVAHLARVREMFETCDVFVFTLGLTEAWVSKRDGAVFPIAPGVVAPATVEGTIEFHNFSPNEMIADLTTVINYMREINPCVKIILTVSPVPLIATYEPQHVLVATCYSKSALRVVAEIVSRSLANVAYFPSYEIITGAHARSAYYADDLREVLPEGVATVMSIFKRHYLEGGNENVQATPNRAFAEPSPAKLARTDAAKHSLVNEIAELQKVICDEEILEKF